MSSSDWYAFLSYSTADRVEANALEMWLKAPPRERSIWRDQRDIQPGAPDFFPPIVDGILASANFLVLLSPQWLSSKWTPREFAEAEMAGKKIIAVVHPAFARDPTTPEGRQRKAELEEGVALASSGLASTLGPANWIWLRQEECGEPDYEPVERALATDFKWKTLHSIIAQRLKRWSAAQDDAVLLRGGELIELAGEAFKDPFREPRLTPEERTFLLASQRHEAEEREKFESLYSGAHARSLAFAAAERGDKEPELALLLAVEAVSVASAPEARDFAIPASSIFQADPSH